MDHTRSHSQTEDSVDITENSENIVRSNSGIVDVDIDKDFICAKMKTDELLLQWCTLEGTKSIFNELLSEKPNQKPQRKKRRTSLLEGLLEEECDVVHRVSGSYKLCLTSDEFNSFSSMEERKVIEHVFTKKFPSDREMVEALMMACKIPIYMAELVQKKLPFRKLNLTNFSKYWENSFEGKDITGRIFQILSTNNRYIQVTDIENLLRIMVVNIRSLKRISSNFDQGLYVGAVTVIIFFYVGRVERDRIYESDLRKSNFVETLIKMGKKKSVYLSPTYFNIQSFICIKNGFMQVCGSGSKKFLYQDLRMYDNYALNPKAISMIYHNSIFKQFQRDQGYMYFEDFVWFMLCEEDKVNKRSITFWFNIADIDEDGYISTSDVRYWYQSKYCESWATSQEFRASLHTGNTISLEIIQQQIFGMIPHKNPGYISLMELRDSGLSSYVYNILFNLKKFLIDEPFVNESFMFESYKRRKWNWEEFLQFSGH
eukprot:TRINITY_DN1031_c0_g1_i4.p1 TRINITY_DN1031_c0_g1~~TRINITY_DN1031_c0_g1_i4.p1  ORF type:complete len:486 (-),score=87.44 TRINITY_DN1031_c0_g1_i4:84-1541(-)